MCLIIGINGQLEIEPIENVDVRENPRFLMLDDLFPLHVELVAFVLQDVGHQADAVGEDVDVDVRSLADVSGHDAADEPGTKRPEQPHEAQSLEPHGAKVLSAAITLVDAGKVLNLFTNFGVGGEVFRLDAFATELLGRLALGGVILRFDALVHQSSGIKGDLPAKLVIGHFLSCAVTKPINAARGFISSYLEMLAKE